MAAVSICAVSILMWLHWHNAALFSMLCWDKSCCISLLFRWTPAFVCPSSSGLWALPCPRIFLWIDSSHHCKWGLSSVRLILFHWSLCPTIGMFFTTPYCVMAALPPEPGGCCLHVLQEKLGYKNLGLAGGFCFCFWQCICAYVTGWHILAAEFATNFLLILQNLVVLCDVKATDMLFCDKEDATGCGWSCDSATNGWLVICETG